MKTLKKFLITIAASAVLCANFVASDFSYITKITNSIPIIASAETTSSGIEYIVSNGTAQISGYSGTSNTVTLPEKINGYTVSTIQCSAFKNNNIIRKVDIKSKITILPVYAFQNCSNLETVILPDTLNHIAGSCFLDSSLAYITIPESVEIINLNAFKGCSRLSTVNIKGTTDIRGSAFADCSNLMNINMPLTTTIHYTAFNNCENLQHINNIQVISIPPKKMYPFINSSLSNFIIQNFSGTKNVGFFNTYTLAYANKVVSNVTNNSMSDIQKAKALHDWLCNAVDYDFENTKDAKNHVDYSAFLYSTTVCEGYARAYQHLMQAANIESYYLSGPNHAWNMIKLGNHYFHVDTTWDDGTGTGNYNYGYFLLSNNEIKAKGGDSHSRWSLTTSPLFNYEYFWPWPSADYAIGDINKDGSINSNDLTILNNYILGNGTINKGDTVLADLTFDGVIDIFDLSALRNKVSKQ